MPESYPALEIFARHNSDLGPNGHLYRREESVIFKPKADLFLQNLEANQNIDNFYIIQMEFQAMVEASFILLNSTDNPVLMDEIRPWVEQFKLQGQSGLAALNMYRALQAKQTTDFERSYHAFESIKSQMYAIDHTANQNPYQPGIKTATLVVAPLIDTTFAYLTDAYNKEFNKNLATDVNYNPHSLYTTIAQLKNQQISLRDRTLALQPPLEVIQILPEAYFGFELQEATHVQKVAYQLFPNSVYKKVQLEVSSDGTKWTTVPAEEKKEIMQAAVKQVIKYIRVRNASSENLNFKVVLFNAEIK